MTSEIIMKLLEALSPVILIVISHLIFRVSKYLSAKTKSEETRQLIDQVDDVVDSVVKSVFQTYISKQKIKNNSLEPEIAAKAKEMAVTQIKDNLGQANLDKVQKTLKLPDTDAILSTKVEAAVYNMKKALLPVAIFVFCFPLLACKSPIGTATTIVDTQRTIVTSMDKSVSVWYLSEDDKCMRDAIDKRDQIKHALIESGKKADESEVVAYSQARPQYDDCIQGPKELTVKIATAVDLARKQNKIAAGIILDVIKGARPISIIADASKPVLDLILEIRKTMADHKISF